MYATLLIPVLKMIAIMVTIAHPAPPPPAWHQHHVEHVEHVEHLLSLEHARLELAQLQVEQPAAPAPVPVLTVVPVFGTGPYPGGAFGACVVARESGGNGQVMNATGHYGLYQFSAATWAAYGGSPASFGDASVAEQDQVFANALAAGGQSNWSLYDGC